MSPHVGAGAYASLMDRLTADEASDGLANLPPWHLEELADAVTYAELRCSGTDELAALVADVAAPRHHAAIRVVRERADLSPADRRLLADVVGPALSMQHRRSLPARLRSRADRLLRNVGGCFPDASARDWIAEYLQSPLRARRLAATNLLRRIGVSQGEGELLLRSVRVHADREALELLCRLPGGLPGDCCCDLLTFVEGGEEYGDTYLAALVLARLWTDGLLDHAHAAACHCVPYLRAMGRVSDEQHEDLLVKICNHSAMSREAFTMAASVAGRLRNRVALQLLSQRLEAATPTPSAASR
jgi:hypothetical protein